VLAVASSIGGERCPAATDASDTGVPPNILVMMADDMGFSDIGCYGGEIQTPTLDRLAAHGLRFTQFYNTSRCCPTRACLLTGLYPHQAGVGHMMEDRQLLGYRGDLNDECQTMAEVLQGAGYATYMSGKWHVTKKIGPHLEFGDQHNWPRQRGFDAFFGTIHGAGSFFDPNSLARDNRLIAPGSDDFYYTDAIAANAAQFIAEHDARKPFFLYVAFTSPHWPMQAWDEDIAKYHGRYADGWDRLREKRLARMIELGIIRPQWKLSPRHPGAPSWEEEPWQEWQQRRMEVYAAMVDRMDQGITRILRQLEAGGYAENTLVLFLADNGGCAEEYGSGRAAEPGDLQPRAIERPLGPGELQTRMQPTHSREGRPVRTGRGVMPGGPDTYVAYGREWANASNTPFRQFKHFVHEGGISSPLIVRWPGHIPVSLQGQLVHDPAHLIDIMATCVEVAGAAYPARIQGREIQRPAGISLTPALTGQPLRRQNPLFWEHEGNRAIRDGKWKLVARGAAGKWELYDMEADRSELHDLAAAKPDLAEQLAERWEAWAVTARVKPWPWTAAGH
jgi:arylsulfatase